MKILTTLPVLLLGITLLAQNKDSSLQESLEKVLASQKEKVNLQANVNLNQNAVQIKWTSIPSKKTSQYIIEKSTDKYNWEIVSTVSGTAHKRQPLEYFLEDYQLLESLSYYRLKQIDKKGKKSYSNVIPIIYPKEENDVQLINLFPLASNETVINISFEKIIDKEILLVIRDKKGDEFYSKVIINIEKKSLIAVPIEKEIPKGDYLITATSENQIYSQNISIL